MPTLTKPKRWNEENTMEHLSKLRFSQTLPYVFTEHGVVIATSVLNTPRAVEVSVFVVRAFVKLRQLVLAHKDLASKLDQLERKVGSHDVAIKQLVAAIRQLMPPLDPPKREMGFHTIRDSAKEQSATSKPTASMKATKTPDTSRCLSNSATYSVA